MIMFSGDSVQYNSYVLGMNIGRNLMGLDSMLNVDAVCEGLRDAYAHKQRFNDEEARMAFLKYMNYDVYERVRKYEDQYLTDLAESDKDIVRSRTGLTYKVGDLGNMSNTATHPRDTVAIMYTVKNMAGAVVDPVENRPDTLRTTLMKLPEGLSEGVKLVGQGGTVTLWMPSHLAFGAAGDKEKGIKPNEMLCYELQIVEVKRRRR